MLAALAYRSAAVIAGVLPVPTGDAVARTLARCAFAARVPARAALEANLARLLPTVGPMERHTRAAEAFDGFAVGVARFLRPPRGGAGMRCRVLGGTHLAAARAGGRGVIVLSAHLGDWEAGAALLASSGCPLHLVARPHADAGVERLFAGRRAACGVRVLPARSPYASAAAALRRGEWVALMADRGSARARGASVCAWASALARRADALLLPAICVREGRGRLTLVVEPPLTPEQCRDGAFRSTMQGWLARWPGQWAAFEALPEGLA